MNSAIRSPHLSSRSPDRLARSLADRLADRLAGEFSSSSIASFALGIFTVAISSFSLIVFYQLGCLLMETLNTWSLQAIRSLGQETPMAFVSQPVARERFFQGYSLAPVHREVISFLENPLLLVGCCLVVTLTAYVLWIQSRNETLLVERIQNEIGQARGNFQYGSEQDSAYVPEYTGGETFGRAHDRHDPHGLSPVTR